MAKLDYISVEAQLLLFVLKLEATKTITKSWCETMCSLASRGA